MSAVVPDKPNRQPKRPTGKIALRAALCAVVLGAFIWVLVAAHTPGAITAAEPINVTLSVSCDVAVEAGSATAQAVSNNGAMRSGILHLDAGTTVYQALIASEAVLSSRSDTMGVYVALIDGLGPGEAGPQSGWKFYVNGTAPAMSCDRCVLSNGDVVEWRYVSNA